MVQAHDDQGCSYGGRCRAGPPTTYDFRPAQKNKKNPPGTNFFIFFYLFFWCLATMFHNRWFNNCTIYIIMLYTLKMTLSGSESLHGALPVDPQVIGAALRWLHSLRLPLLFTIIFHHSDWAWLQP